MAKVIHTMLRVFDMDRAIEFYEKAFGLEVADRLDFDSFELVYLRNDESHFEVELTLNKGQTGPYVHGDGYGHLAVAVDDLDAEHERLMRLGLNPKDLVEFKHDGAVMARFFFVEDPDGYKIEVLQKNGRYQ